MSIATILVFFGWFKIMLTLHSFELILLLLYLQDQISHIGSSEISIILHEDLQLFLSLHSLVQIFVKKVYS